MPSRLRVLVGVDGYYYTGLAATTQLKKHLLAMGIHPDKNMPPGLKNWEKIQWMFNLVAREKFLLITREPRRVSPNRSRYIKASRAMGIGRRLGRKPVEYPPIPAGIRQAVDPANQVIAPDVMAVVQQYAARQRQLNRLLFPPAAPRGGRGEANVQQNALRGVDPEVR